MATSAPTCAHCGRRPTESQLRDTRAEAARRSRQLIEAYEAVGRRKLERLALRRAAAEQELRDVRGLLSDLTGTAPGGADPAPPVPDEPLPEPSDPANAPGWRCHGCGREAPDAASARLLAEAESGARDALTRLLDPAEREVAALTARRDAVREQLTGMRSALSGLPGAPGAQSGSVVASAAPSGPARTGGGPPPRRRWWRRG
ncbi:hypothetical protein [Streptomyces sp. JJ38]|uniref:hypothetical protein n=1 Tax=Streptomyces sp. JJ38 TaxID=2738128 RepID=UPI001C55D262|nr:hypothetical protein [Streptomyces sp. JJ38]MBW1595505.1 hypothetical protein [Streptomyces sp. JJ38]